MGIASRRTHSLPVSLAGRFRARLVQMTAVGTLVGCLYGGFALSVGATPVATARAASTSHAVASLRPNVPCGAVPLPC